jgi:hypothetical protein
VERKRLTVYLRLLGVPLPGMCRNVKHAPHGRDVIEMKVFFGI